MNELGMLNMIPVIFRFMLAVVLGTFAVVGVKALLQWRRNEKSPRLTVAATVTGKRTFTAHHRHHTHTSSHTTAYYVTFEAEDGQRTEFALPGQEYGQLTEGDRGILSYQGTRYLGFQR